MTNPNHPSVDQSDRVVPYNLRQSGRTPVQMLISTRVRKSPFWHLSHEAGCWRATVYNRIYHPRGYVKPEDGGAMVEYEALVNRVTMWNGILDSKAAEVNSIPLTPPFKIVWLSKQVTITNPVSVQMITVSIKGSNNAT